VEWLVVAWTTDCDSEDVVHGDPIMKKTRAPESNGSTRDSRCAARSGGFDSDSDGSPSVLVHEPSNVLGSLEVRYADGTGKTGGG
jgi:hypothetical protein